MLRLKEGEERGSEGSETGWNILGKSAQPLRQKANAYIERPNGTVPAWSVCPWGVVGTSPSSSSIIKQQLYGNSTYCIVAVGETCFLPCFARISASALYGCVCACDL